MVLFNIPQNGLNVVLIILAGVATMVIQGLHGIGTGVSYYTLMILLYGWQIFGIADTLHALINGQYIYLA